MNASRPSPAVTRQRPLAWALLLAGAVLAAPAHGRAQPPCPEFPVPEDARLKWVAPDTVFNGVPLQIKELASRESPQRILEFYRKKWGAAKPYYHEYPLDGWQSAIATLRKECFYTVQINPDGRGGTYGLLGISARPAGGQLKTSGAGFPLAPGARVINDIDHYDGGKTGRTLLLIGNQSADTSADYYRRALEGEGWVAILDRAVESPKGHSRVLVLKRGHHEASLSITPRDGIGSSVLVNVVDRP